MEFKAVELLCGVIAKSRAPRATVSVALWHLYFNSQSQGSRASWRVFKSCGCSYNKFQSPGKSLCSLKVLEITLGIPGKYRNIDVLGGIQLKHLGLLLV